MNVNIGGGKFDHPGWVNLDAVTGFDFSPVCTFPVNDKSAPIVYSSHCLEHLNDATVDRVLSEARRVCSGSLVIKLPDFEDVLQKREIGDIQYFQGWGQNKIVHNWKRNSVDDRAAMIFCGYWDQAYGHEFAGQRNAAGYHGPVYADNYDWSGTPHEIAQRMVKLAPVGATFNHQNAWSKEELRALISKAGFTVESEDADEICRLEIPGIGQMRHISMYVLAR